MSLSLQKTQGVDFSWNKLADPNFIFHDYSLLETVKAENREAQAFFRLLALCHTVMPEEKKKGEGRHLSVHPALKAGEIHSILFIYCWETFPAC